MFPDECNGVIFRCARGEDRFHACLIKNHLIVIRDVPTAQQQDVVKVVVFETGDKFFEQWPVSAGRTGNADHLNILFKCGGSNL